MRGMYWQLGTPDSIEKRMIVEGALREDQDLHTYLIEHPELIDMDRDQVLLPFSKLPRVGEGTKQWIDTKLNQLWLEHLFNL